jgi:agmatinase
MKLIKISGEGMDLKELDKVFLNESGINPQIEIEEVSADKISLSSKTIVIAGSHQRTYNLFRKFAESNPGAGMILFDAHPDFEKNDYLRMLVSEKILDPRRLILVGTRAWKGEEREFIELNRIMVFSMKRISQLGIAEVCELIMENANSWPSAYLSIDIDVVDPAFAPAADVLEAGGLTSREILYFMQRIRLLKNLKMIDLAEIHPEKDTANITSKLGAKIVKELV